MTIKNSKNTANVLAEIRAIEATEYCVETNAGTYGAAEAGRKCGCGDPMFADRAVYETPLGVRRESGPSEDRAPGRMLVRRDALNAARKRLCALRAML